MIDCVIVDDEPLARNALAEYCQLFSQLNVVKLCKNAYQLKEVLSSTSVDVVFLDIQMPLLTGIEWLAQEKNPPKIVFTTAYAAYAVESYSFEALDYLLKPISLARFEQAVNKIEAYFQKTTAPHFLKFKTGKNWHKIRVEELLYLEAQQNYVKVVCRNQQFTIHNSFKKVFEDLPQDEFIQTHKSYIVNKKHIVSMTATHLKVGDFEVPVSVRLRKIVQQNIFK